MPSVTLASGVYGLNRFIVLWVPQIVFKNTNKLLYPLLSVVKCFFLFFKQQICHFGLFMNISCLLSCILFLKSVEKAQERGEALLCLPLPCGWWRAWVCHGRAPSFCLIDDFKKPRCVASSSAPEFFCWEWLAKCLEQLNKIQFLKFLLSRMLWSMNTFILTYALKIKSRNCKCNSYLWL